MGAKGSNIVLVGMMGSGKTSVGKELAKKLGWSFLDFDECIEKAQGRSISEIFSQAGEQYFRNLETQTIKEFQGNNTVIATGGGVMQREENVEALQKIGTPVYLSANAEVLWARIQGCEARPLAQSGFGEFKERLERREPDYKRAELEVSSENKCVERIVEEIYEFWKNING
jgi:shikimate kinase